MSEEIQKLERELYELTTKLNQLKAEHQGPEVSNYAFSTQLGDITLEDCFGANDKLLVIHNMGQACRYCTLWADGINGFLPHLESVMSVILVSKDSPDQQRLFANSRGWRFRLASHGGGAYMKDQIAAEGSENMPGAAVYERVDGKILRKNTATFGPGDLYCSMWNLLGLAGLGGSDWTPQYNYWRRPEKLEDGGANLLE